MDKIRLNPAELKVVSFESVPTDEARGTVRAHFITSTPSCINTDCGPSRCVSSPCAC
jgi:hypothetical protein